MNSLSPTFASAGATSILLVDDEPFQAHVLKSALERRVGTVERAIDAPQAFIRLEQPGILSGLRLVIIALHLPGMQGPEFVAELNARVPTLPVLLVGRDGETAERYEHQHVHFLGRSASTEEVVSLAERLVHRPWPRVA